MMTQLKKEETQKARAALYLKRLLIFHLACKITSKTIISIDIYYL